ncbi:hypothetical protein BDE40_2139 [Litoreibacter halocynthiae]|uniref:Uncharacterized protein n=1 Tax=Litoreibacter halocynthiae TaxID=1242689 RepID=A0A4R7LJC9_9RHOB|nr:hypothetical protein [Litoreibacter halocynthiae]TDT75409.1 hypothetical protein BDE40_2139 [Litoreibacter halocynthiae]
MSDATSQDPPQKAEKKTFLAHFLSFIRRPIEYGLIGAAAVLVIWLADSLHVLPLKFKGLGTEVEFGKKEKTVLNSSADQVAALENRVHKMQGELAKVVDAVRDQRRLDVTAAAVVALPEDAGNVSKATLSNEKIVQGTGTVWLGAFDPIIGRWTERSVTEPGGNLAAPEALNGIEVTFEIDVNVRDGLPEANPSYYGAIAKKGVAKKGFTATIVGDPVRYVRPTGIQYWAVVALSYVEASEV